MPAVPSDAATAAAPAVTRAGRVKQVSSAALRSVASEDHEAQQARRSGVTNKAVRRAGANRQGQVVVSGTPKVVISGPAAARRSSARQPSLASLRKHKASPRPATSRNRTPVNNSSAARTPDSLDLFYTTAAAQPRSRTTTSVPASIAGANTSNDAMDFETCPSASTTGQTRADSEPGDNNRVGDGEELEEDMDVDPRSRVGFGGDDAEDWDDGASDEYVPSDVGNTENLDGSEDVDRDEDGAEHEGDSQEEDGSAKKKPRAPRNSKARTKKTQPKASDYNEEVEALLNHGLGFMRALVISEKPMPSVDESIEMAADAFDMAKLERPMVQPPSDVKYISILRRAIPQARGRIKDAARARTGDTYAFDDRPRMESKNRRRYLALVEHDAYTYEKPESFQGPYYHPICYKILKACFFGKSSDDGVAFSEFFAPIKPQTIALIFTAVRMCLDEWKSGSYKALTFTSDVYEPIYKVHLANLKVLEEEDPLFITGLGEELWEDCSEPFDLEKKSKPTVSITAAQKVSGVLYAQERRNARAAQKASAAAAAIAAAAEAQMEI